MNGEIKTDATVVGHIQSNGLIFGTIETKTVLAEAVVGVVNITHTDLPDYEGEYLITPSVSAQKLDTSGRTLREDIEIGAIPYYDVSNEYGRTIYIGGN